MGGGIASGSVDGRACLDGPDFPFAAKHWNAVAEVAMTLPHQYGDSGQNISVMPFRPQTSRRWEPGDAELQLYSNPGRGAPKCILQIARTPGSQGIRAVCPCSLLIRRFLMRIRSRISNVG